VSKNFKLAATSCNYQQNDSIKERLNILKSKAMEFWLGPHILLLKNIGRSYPWSKKKWPV